MPSTDACHDDHNTGCFTFSSLFRRLGRRNSGNNDSDAVTNTSSSPVDLEKRVIHPQFCCAFEGPSPDNVWLSSDNEPLPLYTEDRKDDVYRPEVLATIEHSIKGLDAELRELSLEIHSHPEIMFEEHHAHDVLTKFMVDHGFKVEKHYKLPTAWRATFTHGKGGRTLGVNSEMDALPSIGHACGHNLIAIAGVGVALAVRDAIVKHNVPATIVLLGTPAEEGGMGKGILIDAGAYKGMDACVMCHPTPGPAHSAANVTCLAVQVIGVEYTGHTAHASAAPWEGVNAFDAAHLAYANIAALRQQIKPDHRVHGVIVGPGDLAANVIPDYTKMRWNIRAPTYAEVEVLRERVLNCFKAAALATGCGVKLSVSRATMDIRPNPILAREFGATARNRYGVEYTGEGVFNASTDFGNVTYVVPSIHPIYAIPTEPNGGNHTPAFTASAKTPIAHAETLVVTQALALTGFRVLDDADYCTEVREAFEKEMGKLR